MTEEEIKHLLGTVGTVTKFRLMQNPETGKPKGFGFADYTDADSAASAVRNLNDHEIQGRKIRVDWPHNNDKDSVPQDYSQMNNQEMAGNASGAGPGLPPLPPGIDLPPNLKCADAISNTLKSLPPTQLLDILTQMKSLCVTNPAMAKQLMDEAPQLSYAIFQALVLMNLVDPSVLATVVEQNAHQPQPQQPQQPHMNIPQPQAPAIPQHQQAPPQQYGYPAPQPQMQPMQQMQQMQNRNVPTPQQYAPPPQQQPMAPEMSAEQRVMLEQVMALPQAQIDQLPPAERMQIMQLRTQYQGFGR